MLVLTVGGFERIKRFVLEQGDRRTYCNMYNCNPHYDFGEFHVYLHPATGQANINCDPALSDFRELVIQDYDASYSSIRWEGRQTICHQSGERVAFAVLERYISAIMRVVNDH